MHTLLTTLGVLFFLPQLRFAGKAAAACYKWKHRKKRGKKRKETKMLKKSSLFAAVALLAAGAGALAATYVYLRDRERNLDEFEDALDCENCDGCEGCCEDGDEEEAPVEKDEEEHIPYEYE